jgi:GNAT superfamily N-acetyltransferase
LEPELRVEPPGTPAVRALIAELDALILERYPGLPVNGLEDGFEADGGLFVVAYVEGRAAACGALQHAHGLDEIKRMYVSPDYRRRGLARIVLRFLEAEAARHGSERLVLETGIRQPEAIAFYEAEGWTRIAPYGIYSEVEVSVCFEKRFTGSGSLSRSSPVPDRGPMKRHRRAKPPGLGG